MRELATGSGVAVVDFASYAESVPEALDAVDAAGLLGEQERIILKPNLVNADPHPVTTPVECVEAVANYCQVHSGAQVIIAEGSGGLDTHEAFKSLGYTDFSRRAGIPLVDLDAEETAVLRDPSHSVLPEFHVARCLVDAFIVSIPVLKAHSMSGVTLAMKNLFGCAPAGVYKGPSFRKAKLHGNSNAELHRYVYEIFRFIPPGLCVVDATVGMAQAHLWGPACDPPVNKIVAGGDAALVDAQAAELLGVDWRSIEHIRLGMAEQEGAWS